MSINPFRQLSVWGLVCLAAWTSMAQQSTPVAVAAGAIPRLINYGGVLNDGHGKPVSGVTGVTFMIYKDEQGGAPLWVETQNVTPGRNGQYSVTLGSTASAGLPADIFASGEARWLAVQIGNEPERPRVLLVAVPYAMKAADAETVGGLPASAFVLAAPPATPVGVSASGASGAPSSASAALPPTTSNVTTAGGSVNALPLFSAATDIENSILTQTGTSTINVRGRLNLPAGGQATATAGKNSQPESFVASSFSSATSAAVNQTFQWQAEPTANNTANPSGSLNLLFGSGSATPAETGLRINSNGRLTFAAGQTFPGTGSVSSVGLTAPSSDFTVSGSPVTGSGTLGLGWKVAPTPSNIASAIVKRNNSGGFTAGPVFVAQLNATGKVTTNQLTASGTMTAAGLGLGTTTPTERLDLGNDGNVVISTDPGNDTTPDTVAYNLVGRGTGGAPNKWSIYTAPVGGGFGVPANSLSIWQYPPNGAPGCCLQRFTIQPVPPSLNTVTMGLVTINGVGELFASIVDRTAIYGFSSCETGIGGCTGVEGFATGSDSEGLEGLGTGGADGIIGFTEDGGLTGLFLGDAVVTGNLSKGGGSFKIDHPLDPANKYLYHSFVESPDMMNIYNGNVTTDAQGNAAVQLPEWFEALNRDFRYQLTVIGQFAQAIVASEVSGGQFSIKTDKPNVKVSWQVTGIRQDKWANAHRIPVEEVKLGKERGTYLHPELFGAPVEKGFAAARHPELAQRMKEHRARAAASLAKVAASSGKNTH